MAFRIGKKQFLQRSGQAPGTLLKTAHKQPPLIRYIRYNESEFSLTEKVGLEDLGGDFDPAFVHWLQIVGIENSGFLDDLRNSFGIHKLTIEDIQNTDRRFSLEAYDSYSFQTLKRLTGPVEDGDPRVETVTIILRSNLVISFHEGPELPYTAFLRRIENGVGRIRRSGAGYLCYALNDEALDTWMIHVEGVEDHLIGLEDQVLLQFEDTLIEEIHGWKKHLAVLRWMFRPYRELRMRSDRSATGWFGEEEGPYLNDLNDHAVRVFDLLEYYREVVDDLLMVHMTVLSNRMNRIVKVLTIISTIFIPITFIAGVYGMNFRAMPELAWKWGYPAVLLVMLVSVIVMLVIFRRKRWL